MLTSKQLGLSLSTKQWTKNRPAVMMSNYIRMEKTSEIGRLITSMSCKWILGINVHPSTRDHKCLVDPALLSIESGMFGSQGESEEELKAMDFDSLFIYRPAWVFISSFCCAVLCKRSLSRHAVSVHLYVCPSRSWIMSKRTNISPKFFHLRVAAPL